MLYLSPNSPQSHSRTEDLMFWVERGESMGHMTIPPLVNEKISNRLSFLLFLLFSRPDLPFSVSRGRNTDGQRWASKGNYHERQEADWEQPNWWKFNLISIKCRPRQYMKKQRPLPTKVHSQSYGFSNSHGWMWELDHEEGEMSKNWWFPTVLLEKTLERPSDRKNIKPNNPKGNQSRIFIGRTDAEAETLIPWPPDAKSWLIRKDPDAGQD